MEKFDLTPLEKCFISTTTEKGDDAFSSTGNHLLDILFMAEYYSKNLDEVKIGNSYIEQVFSMFIRDPRFGLGYRDLGRELMYQAGVTPENIVLAGRFDDLWKLGEPQYLEYLFKEVKAGNELAKKWMPRYSSKDLMIAREFAKKLGLNKQQYGKLIKANTVENQMSRQNWEEINFEHVPSLASIKYATAFHKHQSERYAQFLEDVRSGKKELHVATTTVYDIYRNRYDIDADLFYSKLEKIKINCIPIIDVSGSMYDSNDSIGKALSIGKYLADCSTYCPHQFMTFSRRPSLVTLDNSLSYNDQLDNIQESDWGMNTDFGRVMSVLGNLQDSYPDYLIILSDMDFDHGSSTSKTSLMNNWKEMGIQTKIVWWNFNSRHKIAPETDEYGNIFISGYSPMLLKFLKVGFDGKAFLNELLTEYKKAINF